MQNQQFAFINENHHLTLLEYVYNFMPYFFFKSQISLRFLGSLYIFIPRSSVK